MSATLRLFRIEARRSTAIWFVPVVVLITWYVGRESHATDITLWSKTSAQVGQALLVLTPLAGGLVAWIAGRERRRGVDDLLATTPKPAVHRDLVGVAAATGWTLLAYLAAVAIVFIMTLRSATWGSPDLLPVGAAVGTIAFAAAAGYAAGLVLPSRFTPPLVAVALLALLMAPTGGSRHTVEVAQDVYVSFQSPTRYFTPLTFVNPLDYDPFYDSWPNLAMPLMAWLLALVGITLSAIFLRRRSHWGWALLLVSTLVAVPAGARLYGTHPAGLQASSATETELVCQSGRIAVCMHPAYVTLLDDATALVNDLTEPIADLPGVPTRVEQDYLRYRESTRSGTVMRVHFYNWILSGSYGRSNDAANFVREVLCASRCDDASDFPSRFGGSAREVVGRWLLLQAGIELEPLLPVPDSGHEVAEVERAIKRFDALSAEARRAWFEEHFADLRAGRVSMDDLP